MLTPACILDELHYNLNKTFFFFAAAKAFMHQKHEEVTSTRILVNNLTCVSGSMAEAIIDDGMNCQILLYAIVKN